MNARVKYTLFAFLLAGFAIPSAFGQTELKTIFLKDSTTIQGKIVAQNDSTMVVETRYGTLEIRKPDIVRVVSSQDTSAILPLPRTQTIYLNDGTTIKGTIVAETQDSLNVATSFGTMKIPRTAVKRIGSGLLPSSETELLTKPADEVVQPLGAPESERRESVPRFEILGGVSLPVGDFGSTTGEEAGMAGTGFSAGLGMTSEVVKGFELGLDVGLSSNNMDVSELRRTLQSAIPGINVETENWLLFWVLGDVGFRVSLSTSEWFYGRGLVGLMVGKSPELTVRYLTVTSTQGSATASALAYGFGAGVVLGSRFDIGVRYLAAQPEYSVVASATGGTQPISVSGKVKQPTSIFQVTLGIFVN